MAAVQKGRAIVWGCNGLAFTLGIVSATTLGDIQSVNYTRDSDKAYIPDGNGDTIGRVDYNKKKTFTVTVIPNGNLSAAAAKTSLDAWTPESGTLVTITDSDGNMEANHGGVYMVNRVTQNRTNTGAATADIELEQFDANNVGQATT